MGRGYLLVGGVVSIALAAMHLAVIAIGLSYTIGTVAIVRNDSRRLR